MGREFRGIFFFMGSCRMDIQQRGGKSTGSSILMTLSLNK